MGNTNNNNLNNKYQYSFRVAKVHYPPNFSLKDDEKIIFSFSISNGIDQEIKFLREEQPNFFNRDFSLDDEENMIFSNLEKTLLHVSKK